MTEARLVATGSAAAGDALETGDGETARVAVGEAGDGRSGVATEDSSTERIGVATGEGAPRAAVAKQIISESALRAWRYRIISNGHIKSESDGRGSGPIGPRSDYHLTRVASIGVAGRGVRTDSRFTIRPRLKGSVDRGTLAARQPLWPVQAFVPLLQRREEAGSREAACLRVARRR